MERFDAIVVGAGPAGSATALRLARGGARVLLADKKRFPRDKACGGGLTGRAVRELPCDVAPVVEDVVHRFELRVGYRKRFERRSDAPLVLMTRRRRLDAFLAEQAAAAGADFRDGVTAGGLTVGPDGAEVTIGGSRAAAPVLVGADGANGVVARTLGLGGGIEYGIALEGNGPLAARAARARDGRGRRRPRRLRLGLPEVRPRELRRRRLVERGPARARALAPALRRARGRLGEAHRPARHPAADAPQRAGVGGTGAARRRRGRPRRPAHRRRHLRGARVRAARERGDPRRASTTDYEERLAAAVERRTASSWKAKRVLDRHPRLTFEVARLPFVWGAVSGVLAGEIESSRDVHGLARPPLRLLARL